MEIAKLEAIVTADIQPFIAGMDKVEAKLIDFATLEKSLQDLKPFSPFIVQGLQAAKTVQQLEDALVQLKLERKTALSTEEVLAYNTAIKGVEVEIKRLTTLTKEVPPIIPPNTPPIIEKSGRGLTNMLGSVRQLAYILPGIGIAGIFNLAFEAIRKAAEELELFNSQTKELADSNKKAVESYSDEANKVSILVAQLRDENTTRQEKQRIIDELQKIAPAYFGNLKLEGNTVANLTDDYARYGQAILLVAKIKGASDLNQKNVTAQIEEQLHTSERLALLEQKRAYAEKGGVNVEDQKLAILEDQLEAQTKLAQLSKPLLDIIIEAQKELAALGGDPGKPPPAAEKIKQTTKEVEELATRLRELKEPFAKFADMIAIETGDALAIVQRNLDKGPALVIKPKVDFDTTDIAASLNDTLDKLASQIPNAINSIFSSLTKGNPLKGLFDVIGGALEEFGKKMVALAPIIAAIKAAIKTLNPAILFPAGIALIAIGNLLQNAIPKLAKGGVIPPGFPNDSFPALLSSGETVVPAGQLGNLAANSIMNVVVTGRISGSDIVLVQNRQNQRNNRNYGLNFN